MMDELEKLSNFNLIKYTGWYVLTIDRGMGKVVVFQSDRLENVFWQLEQWQNEKAY